MLQETSHSVLAAETYLFGFIPLNIYTKNTAFVKKLILLRLYFSLWYLFKSSCKSPPMSFITELKTLETTYVGNISTFQITMCIVRKQQLELDMEQQTGSK